MLSRHPRDLIPPQDPFPSFQASFPCPFKNSQTLAAGRVVPIPPPNPTTEFISDEFFSDPEILSKVKIVKKLDSKTSVELEGKLKGANFQLATATLKKNFGQFDIKKFSFASDKKCTLECDIPAGRALTLTVRADASCPSSVSFSKARFGFIYNCKCGGLQVEGDVNAVNRVFTLNGVGHYQKLAGGVEVTGSTADDIVVTPGVSMIVSRAELHAKVLNNFQQLELGCQVKLNPETALYCQLLNPLDCEKWKEVDVQCAVKRVTSRDMTKLCFQGMNVGGYYERKMNSNLKLQLSGKLDLKKEKIGYCFGIGSEVSF